MLDKYVVPKIKAPLAVLADALDRLGLKADTVTGLGFLAGLGCVWATAEGAWGWAALGLALNRLADGLDGELARLQGATDAGAFLDIVLDFIFYALFPLGFALHDPAHALPAAVLVVSFVGTGSSFLAFASQAEKHGIAHPQFGYKGLYYLNGLAEGTETIVCFALMLLLPQFFAELAYGFAVICAITTLNRVLAGYLTLRRGPN